MPTVLVDTSCLIALAHLEKLYLLRELFEVVAITPEVREEYLHKSGTELPRWITILSSNDPIRILERGLHRGEASLIQAAKRHPGSLIILDELKGRSIAKREGLAVTGTLGVLLEAKANRLIPAISPLLKELRNRNFRFSEALEHAARVLAGEL